MAESTLKSPFHVRTTAGAFRSGHETMEQAESAAGPFPWRIA